MSKSEIHECDQGQHRISAVYLRQFGFQKKSGQWKITAFEKSKKKHMLEIGRRWTSEKSIDSVTVATNEFDLNGVDPSLRRMLENEFGKIETTYPQIIAELHRGALTEETVAKLTHFIASLVIRQYSVRQVIDTIIRGQNSRQFLENMCMWFKADRVALVALVEATPIDNRLNHACVLAWSHISLTLATFNVVIMKDYDNSGWQTCDEPVLLTYNYTANSILSVDTELFFPLSKDFCLFMYHPKSKYRTHPLRDQPDKTFFQAGKWERHVVSEFAFAFARDYVFFPTEFSFSELID